MMESPFFFVFDASVLRNVQDRRGRSTWTRIIVVSSHTLRRFPEHTLCLFFFLYAQETQVSEGKEHEEHMTVPSGPGSSLMMVQSQFLFQLLRALLYPVALMIQPDHLQCRHVLRHVAEEVSELILRSLCPSFGDQPYLLMANSLAISLGGPHPETDSLDNKRLTLAAAPKLQMLPLTLLHLCAQFAHLHRPKGLFR